MARRIRFLDGFLDRDGAQPGERSVLSDSHRARRHAECVTGLLGRQPGQDPEHEKLALIHRESGQQGAGPLCLEVSDSRLFRSWPVVGAVGQILGRDREAGAADRMASATLCEAIPKTNDANGRPMS